MTNTSNYKYTSPELINYSKKSKEKISFLRIFLFLSILTAGGLSGCFSYIFIRSYQLKFYELDFNNMIQDNFRLIQKSLNSQLKLNIAVAVSFGLACPNKSNWPNCVMSSNEFIARTKPLVSLAQIRQFSLFPIVTPENRQSFEAFALNYYKTDGNYPNTTGYSSFGPGIFDFSYNGEHIKSPNHTDPSITKYDILTPVLQISDVRAAPDFLLSNAHSDPSIRISMDDALDCIAENLNNTNSEIIQSKCSAITDYIPTYWNIYSGFGTPIFPANDPTTIVGFTGALFNWESVLTAISHYDANYQCVIESTTSDQKHYYIIENGVAHESNSIKMYNSKSDKFNRRLKQKYILNVEGMFSSRTVYSITYYSTNKAPSTFFATIACICCIGITLLISFIFGIFSILIKGETTEANMLLDSKRAFVRFISHEIRTPLNTINLSIRLLQENLITLKNSVEISMCANESLHQLMNENLELVDELNENSTIAVTTLNDLINYDKVETNTFTIEKKDVNLWSVVTKTITPLTFQAKEKNINMSLTSQLMSPNLFPPETTNLAHLRVFGDSIKLGQVIRNLVSNALKFTPTNGDVKISIYYETKTVHITSPSRSSILLPLSPPKIHSFVGVEQMNQMMDQEIIGNIIITVTDNGPGLTNDQKKSLFKQGIQFNPNQLQAGQGSGLGLWIAKEIITLHSGTIEVESEGLGHGSTFKITLPVYYRENLGSSSGNGTSNTNRIKPIDMLLVHGDDEENIHSPTRNEPFSPQNTGSHFDSTPTVPTLILPTNNNIPNQNLHYALVCDDATSNRKLVCRILKSKGFYCHEAENGLQCIEMILSNEVKFDFLLLDYEMPFLDGPSTAKKLREMKYDILIIGITGNVLPEDKEFFIQQGANYVLPKPVKIEEILDIVHYQTKA